MKQLKHPATLIAAVALFMALSGGAIAAVAVVINGASIKNHTIATKKLTSAAVKQLQTRPLVTFDATATSPSPVATPLGTFLGMTFSAACATDAGDATLIVNITTPNGAWKTDVAQVYNGGSSAGYLDVPAGTIAPSTPLTLNAAAGGDTNSAWLELYQQYPGTGDMVWNLTSTTTTASPSCHFSLQYSSDKVSAHTVAGHPPAAPRMTLRNVHSILGLGGLRLH